MTAPLNEGILTGFPPLATLGLGAAPVIVSYTTAGTFTYQVPLGVTRILAEGWGAGGAAVTVGGDTVFWGGSGYYALASIPVQPGELLTILTGAATAAAQGQGNFSSLTRNGVVVLLAAGAGNVGGPSVGDLVLTGAVSGSATWVDSASATQQIPVPAGAAPRGSGEAWVGVDSALNQVGTWPGGGAMVANAGAQSVAGAAGGMVLYVPTPVILT